MEKKIKEDEVDLLELLFKTINVIRSNSWAILTLFLIGIGLGVFHFFSTRKSFENKMVISSSILTKSYGKILIDNLNRHIHENDVKTVTTTLKISESTIREISSVRIDNLSEVDDQTEKDRFLISVEVFNQEILPELQQGLIYYFDNNEFVKVRVAQNENYFKQMISRVDRELKDMEEFKQRIFTGEFFKSTNGNLMFDPTSVNSKILELTKEKLTLQNGLELVNSVHVIEGFNRFVDPTKPNLTASIVTGASVGMTMIVFFLVFKSIHKLLRMSKAIKPVSS